MEARGFFLLLFLSLYKAGDAIRNYTFVEEEMTYWDAKEYCLVLVNGALVSLEDGNAVKELVKKAEQHSKTEEMWIGLTAYQTNVWRWENKAIKTEFTNWKKDLDTDFKWERCALSNKHTGEWTTRNCGEKNAFICETGDGIIPDLPDIPVEIDGDCPEGFVEVGAGTNKCFKVVELDSSMGDEEMAWDIAILNCSENVNNSLYPDIASIDDFLQQAVINAQLKYHFEGGLWIGMRTHSETELEDDDFVWTDNSNTEFKYFGEFGATNMAGAQCVSIYAHQYGKLGEWRNDFCKMPKGYVCQVFKDPANIITRNKDPIDPNPNKRCSDGYTDDKGMLCYKLIKEKKTWEEAEKYCKNQKGSSLISFWANVQLARLTLEIHRELDSVWIGLVSRNHDEGVHYFEWSNGQAIDYLNWADGQPFSLHNGTQIDGCVEMSYFDGTWSNAFCDEKKAFVCMEVDKDTLPLPIEVDKEGICPGAEYGLDLWKADANSDKCYLVVDRTSHMTTWKDAELQCHLYGSSSNLLSIETMEEYLFVKSHLSQWDSTPFWIGLYATNDHWLKWSDRRWFIFENFAIGEPNFETGHCTEMMMREYPYRWRMSDCQTHLNYVCKAPKHKKSKEKDNCPEEFHRMGDSCYSFHPEGKITFFEAQERCQTLHPDANLASVLNYLENEAIREHMIELDLNPVHTPFWIGLDTKIHEKNHGHYQWLDGNKYMYANWASEWDRPYWPGEQCAIVNPPDGKWHVSECAKGLSQTHAYVCKMKNPGAPNGNTAGKIAGIVIGSLIAILLVVAVVYYLVVHADMGQKIANFRQRTESQANVADAMDNPNFIGTSP